MSFAVEETLRSTRSLTKRKAALSKSSSLRKKSSSCYAAVAAFLNLSSSCASARHSKSSSLTPFSTPRILTITIRRTSSHSSPQTYWHQTLWYSKLSSRVAGRTRKRRRRLKTKRRPALALMMMRSSVPMTWLPGLKMPLMTQKRAKIMPLAVLLKEKWSKQLSIVKT